jgi:cupin fold WbuC family metalloprotein
MSIIALTENTFRADTNPYVFTALDRNILVRAAQSSSLQRARINIHQTNEDAIHEMIIAFTVGSIVLPHYHPNKVESFHILEGSLIVKFYTSDGGCSDMDDVILNADIGPYYYRLNTSAIHEVKPLTELVIVHETTNGPFLKGESSIVPSWALS